MKKKVEAQRAPNFKEQDTELLLTLVRKYKDVLETKQTDVSSWREKNMAWDNIAQEVNRVTGINRSAKTIRDKYKNLKTEAKKKFAEEKCEVYKTGGGKPFNVEINSVDLKMKDLCELQMVGLENHFDNDAIENIYIEVEEENDDKKLCPPSSQGQPNVLVATVSTESETRQELSAIPGPKDQCSPMGAENNVNWSSWNPTKLREKISPELLKSPLTPRQPGAIKKTKLTQDCRVKFNTLSETKIELLKLQIECQKTEKQYRLVEHTQTIKQMSEDAVMKREKHNLEMLILKKKLDYS